MQLGRAQRMLKTAYIYVKKVTLSTPVLCDLGPQKLRLASCRGAAGEPNPLLSFRRSVSLFGPPLGLAPHPCTFLPWSESEYNFIDIEVAQQTGFPLEPLETPLIVKALEGKFLAGITHQTTGLQLILSSNHWETISFILMRSPSAPLVLGHPWLVLHNPHIDMGCWQGNQLEQQLPQSLTAISSSTHSGQGALDLSCVPACYYDLARVFSKDCALSLPSNHPYDCGIDLVPGTPFPSVDSTIHLAQRGRAWRGTLLNPWQRASFSRLRPP